MREIHLVLSVETPPTYWDPYTLTLQCGAIYPIMPPWQSGVIQFLIDQWRPGEEHEEAAVEAQEDSEELEDQIKRQMLDWATSPSELGDFEPYGSFWKGYGQGSWTVFEDVWISYPLKAKL